MGWRRRAQMHIAQKFEGLLEMYRRPDGRKWSVQQIRAGKLTDPSMKQVVTLAEVFGVHPTYFLDSTRKLPLLDQEAMSIFRDETVSAIAHKSLHLPGREKQMILGIIRQFEGAHQVDDER